MDARNIIVVLTLCVVSSLCVDYSQLIVQTIAGNGTRYIFFLTRVIGTAMYNADNIPAKSATLNNPWSCALAGDTLYITGTL